MLALRLNLFGIWRPTYFRRTVANPWPHRVTGPSVEVVEGLCEVKGHEADRHGRDGALRRGPGVADVDVPATRPERTRAAPAHSPARVGITTRSYGARKVATPLILPFQRRGSPCSGGHGIISGDSGVSEARGRTAAHRTMILPKSSHRATVELHATAADRGGARAPSSTSHLRAPGRREGAASRRERTGGWRDACRLVEPRGATGVGLAERLRKRARGRVRVRPRARRRSKPVRLPDRMLPTSSAPEKVQHS